MVFVVLRKREKKIKLLGSWNILFVEERERVVCGFLLVDSILVMIMGLS